MGGNVAGATGIAIVPPSTADVRALFDDEKGIHSGFVKLDGHAEARESCADDEDVNGNFGSVRMRRGGFGHARAILLSSVLDFAGAACEWRNAAASCNDWRPSGIKCGAICQACGTTGQIFSSTGTPAAGARWKRGVESSRRTSSAPT